MPRVRVPIADGACASTVWHMDILVWRFDGTTRRDGGGWDAALVERLRTAGASVRVVDPYSTDPLSRAADGYVLSGGSTAVRSTRASRRALRHVGRLVEHAVATARPVVGVCLGAQMLACAIAGEHVVRPEPSGLEVGLVDVNDADGGVWRTSTFHRQSIAPRFCDLVGVQLTASNDHSVVQAFRYGPISATQFHPELDARQLAEAVEVNPDWVPDPAAVVGALRGRSRPDATLRRWLLEPLGLTSPVTGGLAA